MRTARSLALAIVLLLILAISQLPAAQHFFAGAPPGPVGQTTQPSAPAVLAAGALGSARGYLITPAELRAIKRRAERGERPYAENVRAFLGHESLSAPDIWPGAPSITGSPVCADGRRRDAAGQRIPRGPLYLIDGSRLAYAKLLAAHLTTGTRSLALAQDARARILDLTDTTRWGGEDYSGNNQCVLYLSWYVTGFIMAADLLEEFPAVWTSADKAAFQAWLAEEVYPKAAWASRARTNNWGSGGSYAAAMVADYLWDSDLTLREVQPQALELTPREAYLAHTAEQLSRMSTAVAPRDEQDSRCLPLKGIQPSGAIPDELRRAEIPNPQSMCRADHLPRVDGGYAASLTYQVSHVEALVAHAELALRRGDRSLYDNVAADGSGSILRAIHFVVANPLASHRWEEHRLAMLFVAQRYYRDPAIAAQLRRDGESLRSGDVVTFGQVTHDFAATDTPALPPVATWDKGADAAARFETSGGTWELSDGAYTLSSPVRGMIGQGHGNTAIYREPLSGNVRVSVRGLVFESGTQFNDLVLVFSYRDAQNYAFVSLNESNDQNTSGIFLLVDGVQREIVDITTPIRSETWYEVSLDKAGTAVSVRLDGAPIGAASDRAFGDGRVGVATFNDAARFSDLRVQAMSGQVHEEFTDRPAPFESIGGRWRLEDGAFALHQPLRGKAGVGLPNIALYTTPLDGDIELRVRATTRETGTQFNDLALVLAYQGPRDYAFVSFNESNDGGTSGVFRVVDGVQRELADITTPIRAGAWHTIGVVREGATLRVSLDGAVVAELRDPALSAGRVGFGSLNDAVAFDDLLIIQPKPPTFPLAD